MLDRLLSCSILSLVVLLQITFVFAYDASSMQFHPDGRVLQIEYSKDAVKKGGPVGAYRCKDGIVIIAVRKGPISKFLVNPLQKVFQIDRNIVIAGTGLLFDANVIVDVAKRISLQHRSVFCDEIPVESLCEDLSEIMHKQVYLRHPFSFLFHPSLSYFSPFQCAVCFIYGRNIPDLIVSMPTNVFH